MVYKDYLLKDLNQRDSLFHQIQGELAHLLHHVPYLPQVFLSEVSPRLVFPFDWYQLDHFCFFEQILDIINKDTHKEIIAKLDYDAPSCPECGNQLKKYDFQKPSKIPYLETTGIPTRILLRKRRKRRFKCYHCSKMMVAETSIVKKNHQIPRIINQKIAQKLIEKNSMTDIAHQLAISTSTVIRKLNDFHFKHDFSRLPEIMSWDVETVRGVTVSIGRWR
ncbi:degenerate transposase [Streptococcus pneumoniae]|nr:degenerate transposase [Streptococcus pneumoniae]